jgi:hypothetical protein
VDTAECFLHQSYSLIVGSYDKHAKIFPTEMLFMLLGRVRGEIRAHFSFDARLPKV